MLLYPLDQKKKKSNFDLFLVVVILNFATSPPIAFAKSLTLDTSSNICSSRHGIRTRARCALRPLTPLPPQKKPFILTLLKIIDFRPIKILHAAEGKCRMAIKSRRHSNCLSRVNKNRIRSRSWNLRPTFCTWNNDSGTLTVFWNKLF